MFFPVRTITVITCLVSLCIPVVIFYFGVAKHTVTLTAGIGWSILFFLLAGVIFYSWKIIAIGSIFTCSVALVCLINLALLPVIYLSPLYRNDQTYQSLRGVRNIQGIDRLDYYHLGDAKLPQVWDIGKVVKTLPKTKEAFPYGKLPIVLFSDSDPREIKNTCQLESIEVQIIGKYKGDTGKFCVPDAAD